MNRFFTLLLAATCLTAVGQVPDYVPTDGLVAWFDFGLGPEDQTGNLDLTLQGGAQLSDGTLDVTQPGAWAESGELPDSFEGAPAFTVVAVLQSQMSHYDAASWGIGGGSPSQNINSWNHSSGNEANQVTVDLWGETTFGSGLEYSQEEFDIAFWSKMAGNFSADNLLLGLNEQIVGGTGLDSIRDGGEFPNLPAGGRLYLGKAGSEDNYYGPFKIKIFGLFNRALDAEEYFNIRFNLMEELSGCTDGTACNYDDLAVMNDGSCLYLPSMTLPDSVATCEDFMTLEAPEEYDSYSWSTSETTPSVQITESGTYTVEGHVFGPWGWVTGEEVSVTFWNTLQETPNEGCAEMYSSDGFHIADCSEAKLFVLEFDSMEELGGGDVLSMDGFTYVNPEDMLECNSGLDVGLSGVYFLSTEALSFGEAESICEGLGGHLVSINSEEENNFVANIDGCYLGCGNTCPGFWIGMEREVCSSTSSIEVTFSMEGCTDPEACNYNPEASCDNGTCASCEALATACGAGTVWDPISLSCIVANPADTNFDGCVQLNDLLDVLSAYGNCGTWQCGDPLEYQGYEYSTVQIGEQCWFAENLRNANFRNGDPIPTNLDSGAWSETSEGATSVYDDNDENLEVFGRLYNFFVVVDPRSICPSGWRVPSDEDVIQLESELGMSEEVTALKGFRGGILGQEVKSTTGWSGTGNGTNASGLNVYPAGNRYHTGTYLSMSEVGSWWTSTVNADNDSRAWYRSVSHDDLGIYRESDASKNIGFSIRCIKDSE